MFAAAEFADERAYYRGQLGTVVGTAQATSATRNWTAGLAIYDISQPASPRRIGFMPVAGGGIHRIWYTGGRWAYASALIDGFTDYIFIPIDMSDPAQPREAEMTERAARATMRKRAASRSQKMPPQWKSMVSLCL